MSIENYRIFIAGGATAALVDQYFADRRTALKARITHAHQTAGPKAVPFGTNRTYMGISTPEPPPPDAWKPAPKGKRPPNNTHPPYVPNTRSALGKTLAREMAAKRFVPPRAEDFSEQIGFPWQIGSLPGDAGMCMYYAQPHTIGTLALVLVPKLGDLKFVPAGCEEIPLSRYYALVEAEEAQKAVV